MTGDKVSRNLDWLFSAKLEIYTYFSFLTSARNCKECIPYLKAIQIGRESFNSY